MPKRPNTYDVIGRYVLIDISTPSYPECYTKIDLADLSRVLDGGCRWHASRIKKSNQSLYAIRVVSDNGRDRSYSMHRWVLGITDPKIVADHIDGNGLDNTRANLRRATFLENSRNLRKRISGTKSRYKGVNGGTWSGRIKVNRKYIHLGVFATEVEAAQAYDRAAKQYFGDFARINFPESPAQFGAPNGALNRKRDWLHVASRKQAELVP